MQQVRLCWVQTEGSIPAVPGAGSTAPLTEWVALLTSFPVPGAGTSFDVAVEPAWGAGLLTANLAKRLW